MAVIILSFVEFFPSMAIAEQEQQEKPNINPEIIKNMERKVILSIDSSTPLVDVDEAKTEKRVPINEITKLQSIDATQGGDKLLILAKKQIGVIDELKGKKVYLVAGRYKANIQEKATNRPSDEVVFTYYNYDIQRAVDVFMKKDRIMNVMLLNENYQPPVSRDEVEEAKQRWVNTNDKFSTYPEQYFDPRVLVGTDENNNRIIYFQNKLKERTKFNEDVMKGLQESLLIKAKDIKIEDYTKPVMLDLSK